MTWMGKDMTAKNTPFASTYTPPTTSPVLNSTANIGSVLDGGAPLTTGIMELTLTLMNNLRSQPAIGYKTAYGVGMGRFDVKGTMNVYLADVTMLQAFINASMTSLSWVCTDGLGQTLKFVVPNLMLGPNGSPRVTGINTDVMDAFDWQAAFDPGINGEIQITAETATDVYPGP